MSPSRGYRRCPGSSMLLDGPKGTEAMSCPHCAQLVPVVEQDPAILDQLPPESPRFRIRGHQLPDGKD